MALITKITLSIICLPCFFILALWQNRQFFVHISKIGLKALYYKALSHFLATILSTMPYNIGNSHLNNSLIFWSS